MNPLDQYLAKNPDYFLLQNPEDALINPDNPLILLEHLQCAAAELPFEVDEGFGGLGGESTRVYLDFLVESGVLYRSKDNYHWISNDYPSQHVSLRNTASANILLECEENGQRRVIGEIDYNSGLWMVHPGAIYLHDGETYRVETLDLEKNIAILSPSHDDYLTEPVLSTEVEVINISQRSECEIYQKMTGEILVNSKVEGFKRLLWSTRDVIDQADLELPVTSLRTVGYWITLEEICINKMRDEGSWRSDPNDYGDDWQLIRSRVRKRDHYTCQVCGRVEIDAEHHVHHKVPYKLFSDPAIANTISNLVTLCQSCHRLVESQVRVRSAISGLRFILESLSPLMVMCDTGDLAGFADPSAKFADKKPAIIFYDNIPAGIGFSEHLYQKFDELLVNARDVIEHCECKDGCPSCVGPSLENSSGGKMVTLQLINLLLAGT
jgi:DEAD/DEAH box helicase domain-containing protein